VLNLLKEKLYKMKEKIIKECRLCKKGLTKNTMIKLTPYEHDQYHHVYFCNDCKKIIEYIVFNKTGDEMRRWMNDLFNKCNKLENHFFALKQKIEYICNNCKYEEKQIKIEVKNEKR